MPEAEINVVTAAIGLRCFRAGAFLFVAGTWWLGVER